MTLSLKEQSREFEVVSVAFRRSLKALGIEPVRFRALPLRQRKLALFEAIYKTAQQVCCELHWYEDRSELKSKRLWDFTVEQIAQHKTIVDALIAFVCLGETSFIRPLVSYLSFPEPRWSILIDSVLRAIILEPMRGSLFRIPAIDELSFWRKWAIEQSEATKLRDYSDLLLSDIGLEDIKRLHSYTYASQSPDSSFLINRNELFKSNWKYFDDNQARFCTTALYPQLKLYEFERFAESIDNFVTENPSEGNFNTLVACTNDWISELELPKSKLKQNWLALLHRKDVSSRTGAILFQILVHPRKDRKLARDFGRELMRGEANVYVLAVLGDILAQNQSTNAIYRIAKAYSEFDNLSEQTQGILADLNPMASITVHLWTENLLSREIESLCILGGEKRPNARLRLVESIASMLKANDRSIMRLAVFHHSSNPSCRKFANQMARFHKLRKPFAQELSQEDANTSHIILGYLRLIREGFNKLAKLLRS